MAGIIIIVTHATEGIFRALGSRISSARCSPEGNHAQSVDGELRRFISGIVGFWRIYLLPHWVMSPCSCMHVDYFSLN